MKRIEWLDYMKGVAILIVVIGHVTHNIGGKYHFSAPIVVCEMPLFFMLSGILANKITKRTITENYKKKIQSLGIPLFVVGTVFNIVIGGMYWFLYDVYHMGFWFLLSLLSCWLIFIPLLKGIKFLFKGESAIVSGLGDLLLFLPFVVYKLLSKHIPIEVDDALSLNFTLTYYRFFVVGYFVGLYYKKVRINTILWVSVVLTVGMLIMIWLESPLLKYVPMTVQQLILSVCLSATIYVCYRYSHKKVKSLLNRYGRNSLVIYMFHIMTIKYVDVSFLQNTGEVVAFLGTLAISILLSEVSMLAFYPVEHNKYLRKYVLGKF